MKTLPTVNTLQPILHNQIPVITTELLAKLYGTDVDNIKKKITHVTQTALLKESIFSKWLAMS